MADKLKVAVVTPGKQVATGEVDMVVAPSVLGEVGILPNHRPLLADMGIGQVELRVGQKSERYAVSGGFLEVDHDRVSILAEAAERSDEIDVERAKAALKDADAKLKKLDVGDVAYAAESLRADRARNRLRVAAA